MNMGQNHKGHSQFQPCNGEGGGRIYLCVHAHCTLATHATASSLEVGGEQSS